MVKFKCGSDGKPTIVGFGLSAMNIENMMNGLPIHIKGADIGIDHDVLIMYGKTEEDIAKELEPYMAKGATVHGVKG